jgi:hypothetical protein
VLPEPPKLASLPLTVHEGDGERSMVLEGEGLDRISNLSAPGVTIVLADEPADGPTRRTAKVTPSESLKQGSLVDLSISVQGYPNPISVTEAVRVAGPRPKIREVQPSLPSNLPITLRSGELPAGIQIGAMFHVSDAGDQPAVRLSCRNSSSAAQRVVSGAAGDRLKLSPMQSGMYFLSFDPGLWAGGCLLTAVLENSTSGESDPFELGRVVRLPQIDEFRLTDEASGDGNWVGILVGRDLELIGKTGWEAQSGLDVLSLPTPVAGDANRQALRVRVAWPSPTPRSPLYIWFRGEQEGRATTVRP